MKRNISSLLVKLIDKENNVKVENKRVLINDCQKLGNYIFKTPLIKKLSENGYEVTVLGSSVTKELIEDNPYIDGVIHDGSYQKKSSQIFKNIYYGFKYGNEFNYYIEATGSIYLREILFMKLLNSKIYGVERKKNMKLSIMNKTIEFKEHLVDATSEIVKLFNLDIDEKKRKYEIYFSDKGKYETYKKEKPIILFNNLASTKKRSISAKEANRIFENLKKEYPLCEVIWIEREKTIKDLCGLIKLSDLVVSVDTGIVHIASAYNKPIIVQGASERVLPLTSKFCNFKRINITHIKNFIRAHKLSFKDFDIPIIKEVL